MGSKSQRRTVSEIQGGMKKAEEKEALNYFLDAYEPATNLSIKSVDACERPDFTCVRSDGKRLGIELTQVRRGHPEDILWDRIIERQEYMSVDGALYMLQQITAQKESKRSEPDWARPEETILVIELTDIPLSEIKNFIAPTTMPDLYTTGFEEVWLADFTGLEAYDNVELFCVKPDKWAGYYPRVYQKPYG